MLVQPVPLVVQREPEHPRLQQYIVDNPEVNFQLIAVDHKFAGCGGWPGLGDGISEGR